MTEVTEASFLIEMQNWLVWIMLSCSLIGSGIVLMLVGIFSKATIFLSLLGVLMLVGSYYTMKRGVENYIDFNTGEK